MDTAAALRTRRRAILLVMAASATFCIVAALVKALPRIPAVEVALFRASLMGAAVLVMLHRRGGLSAFWHPRRPLGHAARTLCGFVGMVTAYYGYTHLPLAANTALGFAMPLILTLLSRPFLGERVGWRRYAAVFAGLLGVLIMIRPWNDAAGLPLLSAAIVMVGVVAWAGAMVSIRRLGQGGESNEAILLWFALGSAFLCALFVVPVWVTPTPRDLLLLVLLSLISTVAQLMMTEGYRTGEASVVAPFEYGAIIYTTILGMTLWGEFPDAWSWAGVGVIVASGLYVWQRETRAARRAAR
jgi:drug/metabolite transporter (DMT)-like permease